MNRFFKNISEKKKGLLILSILLIVAITFETLQQLYYINRYNISADATFFGLLKTQSKSWFIWFLLAYPLTQFIKVQSTKSSISPIYFLKSAVVILTLVLASIFLISYFNLVTSEPTFSVSLLVSEYLPFFLFQKLPIFTLGYIAIAVMAHLYYTNAALLVKMEELGELKKTNTKLYNKLSKEIDDKSTILNIKIGNKRKIIPVEKISWIEADDYCVKVYTLTNECYTMRSSLKALETKLDSNFLRVHRKAIVNMKLAKELNLTSSPKLIIKDDTEIPVSKSNLKFVKNFLL